jgi:putative transposase
MAKLPRIVIPECPHHITQRGNRKQKTFFCKEDYEAYIDLLAQASRRYDLKIIAYCLMPNHVHLIVIPNSKETLSLAMAEVHENYAKQVNFKMGWSGCLWQGRYFSVPMDENYTERCIRYVELNPVRASLCSNPEDYQWSSARANLNGIEDKLIRNFSSRIISNWRNFLDKVVTDLELEEIRKNSRTGRPLGSKEFIESLEDLTGMSIFPKKPGRKAKSEHS